MATTLGGWLTQRDRERLVGRRAELATLERMFTEGGDARVVLLHGPGGIGKSALLREFGRRGEHFGWAPVFVEGRELPLLPGSLESAVAAARDDERPLVLIDSFERIGALGVHLRRDLLPGLPERAVVMIAGRGRPDRSWFEGGWEGVTVELELGPLPEDDAEALLHRHGVSDRDDVAELIGWADGSPLALAMGADQVRSSPESAPSVLASPLVVRGLLDRLAGTEIEPAYADALAIAATARVTTPDLLRDALPDGDADAAFAWLASRSFCEPLGEGVALHELVRKALYEDLRRRDPERERQLRRRIADHLYLRGVQRNLLLSRDLSHLVQDEKLRWGYSWEGGSLYRIDDVAPGDRDEIGERLAEQGAAALLEASDRFFSEAPGRIAVARDADGRLCGYQVSITPSNAPDFADEHPLLGPWLEDARNRSPEAEALLWSESVDFTRGPGALVQAMLGMAGILRSGLENPRYAYAPINPRLPGALEFCEALGARHLPHLDARLGSIEIQCHLFDYGPRGILGAQRDVVYMELGLAPPEPGAGIARDVAEEVRDALRNIAHPSRLAESRLARGVTPDERAESVRRLLTRSAEQAFGDTPDERLLRSVLVAGYLDPATTHETTADSLHLSRSAYFRRLKAASDRVAEWVAAEERSGR